jgi:peptide/nickel transport system substrate-binding protein
MNRSTRLLAGAAALALFAFAADTAQAQAKKTVRSVPIGSLRIIDPIWTTAYITRNHAYMVWDTLFAVDAENVVRPQMVETWQVSDDRLTYSFTLRDGMKWHDGQPVTAADCVASLKRWGAKDGMGRALMDFVATIETIDAKSFRLVLKQPVGFVLDALGKIDSNVPFMMPERVARTDPNTQITEVIGSGPFRFVQSEWNPGSKVVYERFDGYVPRKEPASQAAGGKVVKIDRVESVYMPDAAVQVAALRAGEIDLLESPPNDLIRTVENDPNIEVRPNDPLGSQLFMVINHLHAPFDKKEVRHALLWAVRQTDFLASVVGDPKRYQACAAVFGCKTPNESSVGSEALLGYDLEKARGMLKAAGYEGKRVVLMDPADNSTLHPPSLLATQVLRRAGFTVDVQAMDWSTLTQRRASKNPPESGGWSMFITNSTITGVANPIVHTYAKNCDQAWYGWPCEPRIVELTRAWSLETDAAKRKSITDELQRLHLDHVSYVPLGQYVTVIAFRKSLRGVINAPAVFYWNVEKG